MKARVPKKLFVHFPLNRRGCHSLRVLNARNRESDGHERIRAKGPRQQDDPKSRATGMRWSLVP